MTSREKILQSVRANLPPQEERPPEWESSNSWSDLKDRFAFCLDAIGGVTRFFTSRADAVAEMDNIESEGVVRDLIRGFHLEELPEEPEVTMVEARLAIAENGAIFVTDKEVPERNHLFLGQKLIALVPQSGLISDMHEAYDKIRLTDTGFGIFIAGPSATADIAQILVRGAHGPSQMEVWFYGAGDGGGV